MVEICNEFNKYFINCAQFYDPNNPPTSFQYNHSFSFSEIMNQEMLSTILNLSNKKSVGWDGINTRVLKENCDLLAPVLTMLFNKIIRTASFPHKLKIQKVIPIHKGGNKMEMQFYRPIALLPVVNKTIEKILHNQLYTFLEENETLYKRQFGLRTGANTASSLIDMIDFI